jgi:hypothetical protein
MQYLLLKRGLKGLSFLAITASLAGCMTDAPPPRTADTANYATITEKDTHVGKMITTGLKLQPTYDIDIYTIDGVKLSHGLNSTHLISPGKHTLDLVCVEIDPGLDPDDTYTPTFDKIVQFTAVANKKYQLAYNFPSQSHYKYYENPCDYAVINQIP